MSTPPQQKDLPLDFKVQLPLFEGPFDLLLFFIERDEVDIYDIPIAKITNDFLEYLRLSEELNINLAGEFMLTAATLMRIKSKTLLPRPEIDEAGNEIDPREELVKHLLEYKKYKSVIGELSELENTRMQSETRGNLARELKSMAEKTDTEAEMQDLDMYKLLKAFEKVLKRAAAEAAKPVHRVFQFPFTVEEKKEQLLQRIGNVDILSFSDVIAGDTRKIAVIFNFLAVLELLQQQLISIKIGVGYNNFFLEKKAGQFVEK